MRFERKVILSNDRSAKEVGQGIARWMKWTIRIGFVICFVILWPILFYAMLFAFQWFAEAEGGFNVPGFLRAGIAFILSGIIVMATMVLMILIVARFVVRGK